MENEINHYRLIETNLIENIEELEKEIKQMIYSNINIPKKITKEKLKELKKSEKITDDEFMDITMEFAEKLKSGISIGDLKTLGIDLENRFSKEIFKKGNHTRYALFDEHYYIPLLLKKNTKEFKHIVKVISEIEFLKELQKYTEQKNNKLNDCEWWYFSKLDENIDDIKIPYFDSKKGDYRNFILILSFG